MAIAEHWIVEPININSFYDKKKMYLTAVSAKDAARALATNNPGKTYIVYRSVKEIIAPPQAVQELDPVVTP
jgi:hypothetical protein